MIRATSLALSAIKRSFPDPSFANDYASEQAAAEAAVRKHNALFTSIAVALPFIILVSILLCCCCCRRVTERGDSSSYSNLESGTKTAGTTSVNGNTLSRNGERSSENENTSGDVILEMPPPTYEAACGRERVKDMEEPPSVARF
jgi:hypothetical protein